MEKRIEMTRRAFSTFERLFALVEKRAGAFDEFDSSEGTMYYIFRGKKKDGPIRMDLEMVFEGGQGYWYSRTLVILIFGEDLTCFEGGKTMVSASILIKFDGEKNSWSVEWEDIEAASSSEKAFMRTFPQSDVSEEQAFAHVTRVVKYVQKFRKHKKK